MSKIEIPRDEQQCVDQLGDLGELATATAWHRAAIVAALVGPPTGQGSRSDLAKTSQVTTPHELAARGVHGLRTHATVERYQRAWCVFADRPAPQFGQVVDLDGLPEWPPNRDYSRNMRGEPERVAALIEQAEVDGVGPNMTVKIAGSPKPMQSAIKADEATAQAARRALRERQAAVTAPSVFDFIEVTARLAEDMQQLVDWCAQAPLKTEPRGLVEVMLDRVQPGSTYLRSMLDGPIDDAALHAWIDAGGAR